MVSVDVHAFSAIPWTFYEVRGVRFWVHYGLVILGFLVAVITLLSQWFDPAPYGRHDKETRSWGPQIPQRLGHILSDSLPGVLMFILENAYKSPKEDVYSIDLKPLQVFVFYGDQRGYANYVFLGLFLAHYVHRGIIHPLIMRYRSTKVYLGITLSGFVLNCLYHFINADFIGSASYTSRYYYDPRFLIGLILYVIGFVINRWTDWKLRCLRNTKGQTSDSPSYYIPYGGLFELISCPNYFGEMLQWMGWCIGTWSLAGLVWLLFASATFVPRARHNHLWYKQQFVLYPPSRRALIPFLF